MNIRWTPRDHALLRKRQKENVARIYLHDTRESLKSAPCLACGSDGPGEIHHLDGNHSNDVPENIVKLCLKCHKNNHRYGTLSKFKKLPEKYHLVPVLFEGKQVGELIVPADR